MSSARAGPTAGARLLTALAVAQLLVALDFSIVYVALPEIGVSLGFSAASLQWVVSAYAIMFAGSLLIGGQLVDLLGGGRVFIAAQVLFAAVSVVAATSPEPAVLLLARGAQGVAAGLLVPATLGLLNSAYPAGPRRTMALTVWGTTGAFGLALGMVAGGVLTTLASWRWVFWCNLPLTGLCLAAAGTAISVHGGAAGRRLAAVTAALAAVSVVAVVLAFSELARPAPHGWLVAGSAVVAVGTAVAVIARERRATVPLVPRGLRGVRSLRVAGAAAAVYMATFGAEFYLVTVYLQDRRGYTALGAGLAFLPLAVAVVVGNVVTGMIAGRLPHRRLLALSYAVGAAGLVVLAAGVAGDAGYSPVLLAGFLVSGVGQGMAFTGTFVVATSDLPGDGEGTGSALVTTAQYVGGSVGLAVLVLVLGRHPDAATFGLALLITATAALLVAPLALRALR